MNIGGEIMLRFERTGFDEDAVSCSGFQWFRARVIDGWLHAANAIAVGKHFHGDGIRVGFQFPNGKGIFVALQFADGNDFERGEPICVAECEVDLAEPPVMRDGHHFRFEPVAEMNNINSAKNDRECDENPSFFIHKMNVAAGAAVQPPIQTWQGVEML